VGATGTGAIRKNAERLAVENGLEIEFIRSKKKFLGEHPKPAIDDHLKTGQR
jgi:hypothetical protein